MSRTSGLQRGWRLLTELVRPETAEDRAIPVLDSGLSPNDQLTRFDVAWGGSWQSPPGQVVSLEEGLVFSVGGTLHLLPRTPGATVATLNLGGDVGALAVAPGGLWAVVIGGPVVKVSLSGSALAVSERLDVSVACPTDAVLRGGVLYVSTGSTSHAPADWSRDLMTKGRTGQVVRVDTKLERSEIVIDALAWAGGITTGTEGQLLVSESWGHRVVRLDEAGSATARPVSRPLPGYPGRLESTPAGATLVSIFALRTHLVEFVLREDDYRKQMIATIAPEFWVAPALRTAGGPWEPLQIGSMKHLGVTKPWAPPRSYGLVGLMRADGEFERSWHARVDSVRSGVTSATYDRGHLVVACHGDGSVLRSVESDIE